MDDNATNQYRLQEAERDIERLYARTKEMEIEFRQHLGDLDRKYVRLERYVTVERIVYAFIAGIVVAVGGFVWSVLSGA